MFICKNWLFYILHWQNLLTKRWYHVYFSHEILILKPMDIGAFATETKFHVCARKTSNILFEWDMCVVSEMCIKCSYFSSHTVLSTCKTYVRECFWAHWHHYWIRLMLTKLWYRDHSLLSKLLVKAHLAKHQQDFTLVWFILFT